MMVYSVLACNSGKEENHETKFIDSVSESIEVEVEPNNLNIDSLEIFDLIKTYDLNRVDTMSIGDVNDDGIVDTGFIQPLSIFYKNGHMDSQYVTITFSCSLPPIKHYDGFHGTLVNIGDLDGNRIDELLYYPFWYQSNSASIYIYRYTKGNWEMLVRGDIRRDRVWNQKHPISFLKSRVEKIDNNSYLLKEHKWIDADIQDVSRIIHFK